MFHVTAGSIKIDTNCTATMTVSILSDGSVKAEAILTHYGHDKELQVTCATKRKCVNIAAKLKQGVSHANIEQAYGLKDIQHHPNDQQSVFYKLQGQEAEEGFD